MNNKEQRVLGRILAVEETREVSGAAPTKPCWDQITVPSLDTAPVGADCNQTLRAADSGTIIDSIGLSTTSV
jgi:hypothetical protein